MLSALSAVAAAAIATWLLIKAIFPLLERYALARPNARSSHKTPTAQGGGAAVIPVALAVAWLCVAFSGSPGGLGAVHLAAVSVAAMVLAVIGAFDDIRPLPVLPRLVGQFACATLLVAALPGGARALPILPSAIEAAILIVGLVWFVNLTNFMDGIDGITLAEMLPVTGALAIFSTWGVVPPLGGLCALALFGALLGFAPYNRHVARLFLGDVGSLPIGAIVGWLLILLAAGGHLAAALLLPLYYLLDSTATLFRRWRRGERLSQAHRSHFYQVATTRGFTVPDVTRRILGLNLCLVGLATVTVFADHPAVSAAMLACGLGLTGWLMSTFEKGKLGARR